MHEGAGEFETTGVNGLDTVLSGGFLPGQLICIQGGPGTGKTTLGSQFLLDGEARGQKTLYVTISQTEANLRQIWASHGWPADQVPVHELGTHLVPESAEQRQTVFPTADVELAELSQSIFNAVQRHDPKRVVIDSMASLRLLAGDPLRYRQAVLRLRGVFADRGITVLLLDDYVGERDNVDLQVLVQGIVRMEQHVGESTPIVRHLSLVKLRGQQGLYGKHDVVVRRGGMTVYPRLRMPAEPVDDAGHRITSGNEAYDQMLGGGLERGTACMIIGQAGTGKSTLSMLHPHATVRAGGKAAILLFEERRESYLQRCRAMGMPLDELIAGGGLEMHSFTSGQITLGELGGVVQRLIDDGVSVIVLDSLTGLINAMPSEEHLTSQVAAIMRYISGRGVLAILTVAQHGVFGERPESSVDLSYLGDSVVLLRHFELDAQMQKAAVVIKKRHGAHQLRIRQLVIDGDGVKFGPELEGLAGILSGQPRPPVGMEPG
jgi:circadian clock protein KaiC